MNLIKRTVTRAEQDGKTGDAVERETKATDARRTEQPPDTPVQAELSVVAPTPLSGGCSLRVLQAASFGGVVVATLAAALVGRCRR